MADEDAVGRCVDRNLDRLHARSYGGVVGEFGVFSPVVSGAPVGDIKRSRSGKTVDGMDRRALG